MPGLLYVQQTRYLFDINVIFYHWNISCIRHFYPDKKIWSLDSAIHTKIKGFSMNFSAYIQRYKENGH